MAGHTDNSIVINAPIDLVRDMTNDVASWPRLFSEYSAAEIVERRGDTLVFRLTMHPDEQGRVWSWVSERTPDRGRCKVHAQRIETSPFEYMKIYWEYREVAGGVRMRWVQDFHMKPDAPADDEAMTAYLDRNTKVQMSRIKRLVEVAAAVQAGTSGQIAAPTVKAGGRQAAE